MTEPRDIVLDRLASYAEHPTEEIPPPIPRRRATEPGQREPERRWCPCCGQRVGA